MKIKMILAVLILIMVSGCYLVPRSEIRADKFIAPIKIERAALLVQTTADATEEEMQILRGYLISELESIPLEITNGDYNDEQAIILVNIAEIKRVGFWERFGGGFTVARASVNMRVSINREGKEIGVFHITGESSRTGPGGTTQTALKMAAKAIKKQLLVFIASKKEALQ
ncbi:MAG: hypothetical protein UU85_C0001G0127 [Candidatus Wolfebacteria bacterium GW2011_GWA2_42_10]|uniref:Lipoprotein n=2 Tax=Candidatus Wolfeibacteriota TaxID=1752735 RepID=A0A0G0XMK2_9BACT|nr:MAG: hypothetical protein UU38_C0003G0187 [Candidatus Wolfebacteria bacterium GW2011_GWB1_41_12]KKS25697.1 MAG: hypothetical protein UU85_C0001G0127 [Candidatus Wolfebacteria bacterium GW2011_GWA2_42_10]KKT56371.1 MAG: hypothetical protein UW50_C0002G0048 [Candidatus Wolfebacteria bacterium GW2011_GWA1_44_24]